MVRLDMTRRGAIWQGRRGESGRGELGQDPIRIGETRKCRLDTARLNMARPGLVWLDEAIQGNTWQARRDVDRLGSTCYDTAGPVKARQQ